MPPSVELIVSKTRLSFLLRVIRPICGQTESCSQSGGELPYDHACPCTLLDWQHIIAPENAVEIAALEADAGRYIGYTRLIGRRLPDVKLEEYCWPNVLRPVVPYQYTKQELMQE